ncbi:MAG: rhodanese-like domain-containing protein [Fluviicola sp.]|nr:rhodanese-like domain-containing protein [Fluviicola sp.]
MKIEQLYTNCLAQGAYYIESNGEAAIIDPLRETQPYLDLAAKRKATIKYVFETHFHADFVSGHIDLAKKTGATIVYGPTNMSTGFKATFAFDGQIFPLGAASIKVIHTPGHTMESSCFLLTDENGKETALFTGDTLFIGDVGRPDLAQHVIAELTQEKLAGHLYDSLRNKIMPLNDNLIVYPAHGAGSACGKNMSKETSDTLGNQKRTNYALNPELTKTEFIQQVLEGLVSPPHYFPSNVLMNIIGYESIDSVMEHGTTPLTAYVFEQRLTTEDVYVIDTRKADQFAAGFIPGSINIGIDGDFAVWVGTLISDIQQNILLITEPGREAEAVTRLARIGCDHALGFLEGGFEAWKNAGKPVDIIQSLSADEFVNKYHAGVLLDVRKESEFESEHFIGAVNKPLDFIDVNYSSMNPDETYYIHCAGGYRSMIYASILRTKGFKNIVNLEGGFKALKATGKLLVTEYVCPKTLL